MSLANTVIFITGASRGIGKALAMHLGAAGARLFLVARSQDELSRTVQEIRTAGGNADALAGDIADESFVKQAIQAAIALYGGLDVVVNNAGFGIFKPAADITAEEWDQIFATNAKGTFLVSREAIPFMKSRGAGHIINVASDVAKRTFANGSLYCASKYAQDAFSMALRKEVRPLGIKVSVVYSGLVDSYFHADPQGDASHETWLKNEDMARAISFIINQPAHVVIDELMIHPLSQDY